MYVIVRYFCGQVSLSAVHINWTGTTEYLHSWQHLERDIRIFNGMGNNTVSPRHARVASWHLHLLA